MKVAVIFLMSETDVDVVVRHSLISLLRDTDYDYDLFVVSNNAKVEVCDILDRYGKDKFKLFLRNHSNTGIAQGYNYGLAFCKGYDLVVRYNADYLVEESHWLKIMTEFVSFNPIAAQISMRYFDGVFNYGVRPKVGIIESNHWEVPWIHCGVVGMTWQALKKVGALYAPSKNKWWPVSEDYGVRVIMSGLKNYYVDINGAYFTHKHVGKRNILLGKPLDEFRKHQKSYRADNSYIPI